MLLSVIHSDLVRHVVSGHLLKRYHHCSIAYSHTAKSNVVRYCGSRYHATTSATKITQTAAGESSSSQLEPEITKTKGQPPKTSAAASTGTEGSKKNNKSSSSSRRRRHNYSKIDNIPSYQDFMKQRSILHLYRRFMRAIRPLSVRERKEMVIQIKKEFTSPYNNIDELARQRAMSEGSRRLKELQASMYTKSAHVEPLLNGDSGKSKKEKEVEEEEDAPKPIGQGWPWERDN